MPTLRKALHWIDGEWLDAGTTKVSHNPATGEELGEYVEATEKEAQLAIDVAKRVFRESDWKRDRRLRARVLNNMAERFEARSPELIELLGTENGKVKPHGEVEFEVVPHTLRFNAALALTDSGRAASIDPGGLNMVVRQPVGVAGVIAPWNSPIALGIRSLAPALAAGCTVVLQLPRQTAHVNSLIAEIISETPELPKGVVNFFNGGAATGSVLVGSPDVPSISFTGSTQTGRSISKEGADNLKRFGLELGGKTPLIVFDDADIDTVVEKAVLALVVFAGQFCMTGSRILVQRGVADQVRTKLSAALQQVQVGPASDPASQMGPVIDKPNVERIDKIVEDAIGGGATVHVRGGPFTEGPLSKGSFYAPCLLEVEDGSMPVVQQEVFGPVLTMEVFDTEDEVVEKANSTEYGLAASIWTRDVDRPVRVAQEIEAGTIWINDWAVLFDQFEEGGFKASGVGRMRGLAVLDDFLEFKHITFHPGVVGR